MLTEAFFRLTHVPGGPDRLLNLLTIPDFKVLDWRVDESREEIRTIMKKYADTPASFRRCLSDLDGGIVAPPGCLDYRQQFLDLSDPWWETDSDPGPMK